MTELRKWLLFAVSTTFGCSRAAASTPSAKGQTADANGAGFAVIELFTSEGCSSCPPADDVLRELAEEASRTGERVYPLAFHVDYWNALGWPDPYSSTWATSRQHVYGKALGQQGVYTPEMIINGREAFVGSNRSRAHRSIDSALSRPEGIRIALHTTRVDDLRLSLDLTFSTAPASGSVLQLALVQIEALTRVKAGENAGHTLHHANVVRGFQSVYLDGAQNGRAIFTPAPARDLGKTAIIAFLQDPETMTVSGATRVDL
jgi:hypothetical protein